MYPIQTPEIGILVGLYTKPIIKFSELAESIGFKLGVPKIEVTRMSMLTLRTFIIYLSTPSLDCYGDT